MAQGAARALVGLAQTLVGHTEPGEHLVEPLGDVHRPGLGLDAQRQVARGRRGQVADRLCGGALEPSS